MERITQVDRISNGQKEAAADGLTVLSVVIPVLNEEDGVRDIVRRIQGAESDCRAVGVRRIEVVVVDDGSTDRTAEIVAAMPGVRLLRHSENQGYGAAIKTGFRHAQGDLLAFLDADGTYPPECLPQLCQEVIGNGAQVAVGSRRSGADSEMPFLRRVGNLLWSGLVTSLGGRRCADPASGMRVLRRSVLPRLYPLPDGLNFTPVMSTRSVHEGLVVAELPIPYKERVGRSKLSIVDDGLRFLKTILWTALEYNPSKMAGFAGATLFLTAFGIGATLLLLRLSGVQSLQLWGVFSVYAMLVLGVAGVSIYSLGITSNVLVALFHRQPVRQGLFANSTIEKALERRFGWFGVASIALGFTILISCVALGAVEWDMTRVWFWFLGSALFVLVGLQLLISWAVARVLEKLACRGEAVDRELELDPALGKPSLETAPARARPVVVGRASA